jgi:hypothetical protein
MLRSPAFRLLAVAAVAAVAAACGNRIGDPCTVASDCATDGSRTCDTFSPGGSCTIENCDFGTCPDEAVCVRFFPAVQDTRACTSTLDCALDEICTVRGQCAPRSIERRYCMLRCGGHGDCRTGYECRDRELMRLHGGEPVPDPAAMTSSLPEVSFCASRRSCRVQSDCNDDEVCDLLNSVCLPR